MGRRRRPCPLCRRSAAAIDRLPSRANDGGGLVGGREGRTLFHSRRRPIDAATAAAAPLAVLPDDIIAVAVVVVVGNASVAARPLRNYRCLRRREIPAIARDGAAFSGHVLRPPVIIIIIVIVVAIAILIPLLLLLLLLVVFIFLLLGGVQNVQHGIGIADQCVGIVEYVQDAHHVIFRR